MRRNSSKTRASWSPSEISDEIYLMFSKFQRKWRENISLNILHSHLNRHLFAFFLQDFALAVEQITTKFLPETMFCLNQLSGNASKVGYKFAHWGSEPISSSTWMGALQSAAQTDVNLMRADTFQLTISSVVLMLSQTRKGSPAIWVARGLLYGHASILWSFLKRRGRVSKKPMHSVVML